MSYIKTSDENDITRLVCKRSCRLLVSKCKRDKYCIISYTVKISVYSRGYFVASFPMQCGHTLHYSDDLRIQTYTEPVPLKYEKFATKYPQIYGYFYSACLLVS